MGWDTIESNLETMRHVVMRQANEVELSANRLASFRQVLDYYGGWDNADLIDWLVENEVDDTFTEIAEKYRLGGQGNPFTNMDSLSGEYGGEPALVLVFLIGCIICSIWTLCCFIGCFEKKCKWTGICKSCATLGFVGPMVQKLSCGSVGQK